MMQPQAGMQYFDYEIRAMKKGHLHHTEQVIVRVRGYPNDFAIIVEEEHIGPLGRELINHRLFSNIDRQINDGLYDMPIPPSMQQFSQQPVTSQVTQPMPMQQGMRCPQCGYQNPPSAKFCINCGAKLF